MLQYAITILCLVFLEGMLSLDNAIVLAVMVQHLPPKLRKRALTYGITGAFFFRALALLFLNYIIKFAWLRAAGGCYLVALAGGYFLTTSEEKSLINDPRSFWRTVIMVELTDIAFSFDSIFAAIGVSDQVWTLIVGAILGITMMRYASFIFGKMLEKWPWLEKLAYVLVFVVGVKLIAQAVGVV